MTQWLTRLSLLAGSTVVALTLAESGLRLSGLQAAGQVYTVSSRDFHRIPGIWEPDQDQIVREIPALPYRVTINDLGYRGPAFPAKKPPGQLRILYVGDSFAFGSYVEDDETLPARLQAYLSKACGDVVVINAGLGGSTITEDIPLMERGLALDPDLIILQFSENDVGDLRGEPMWEQLKENRIAKSSFPLGLIYPFIRRSALWGLAIRVRLVERARKVTPADEGSASPDERPLSGASAARLRARYIDLLGRFSQSVRHANKPLIFVVYPSHYTVRDPKLTGQVEWAGGAARSIGLDVIDLTPVLASAAGTGSLYLLPHDGHPSARGYDISAQHLNDVLLSNVLLPDVCRR